MIVINQGKTYPAKTLLFGEYTVIAGGQALSIPLETFSGHWMKNSNDPSLEAFFSYILNMDGYNSDLINMAIDQNWRFNSTILRGYGAGSSGALSAAAYDCFYTNKPTELIEIKNVLSQTESFFHGKSSGLDPLTSFFNLPVLSKDKSLSLLKDFALPPGFYLFDSGSTRNTKKMVEIFLSDFENLSLFPSVIDKLNDLNKLAISALRQKTGDFKDHLDQISLLQLEHFSQMIPDTVLEIWQAGLRSGDYTMKLSGAGGGGYFLLYAKESPELENVIPIS